MLSSAVFISRIWWSLNSVSEIELSGDAKIRTLLKDSNTFGLMFNNNNNNHIVWMNGHTLTIVAGGTFPFRNVTTVGDGTIVGIPTEEVSTGKKSLSFYGAPSDISSVTLDIHDGCGLNIEQPVKVGTFIDRRTIFRNDGTKDHNGTSNDRDSDAGMLTALNRFKPMAGNLLKTITLGDADHANPVLDLSALDDTFTIPESGFAMNYAAGATIGVDLEGRRISGTKKRLVAWNAIPEADFFRIDGEQSLQLIKKEDGLYHPGIGFRFILK